MTPRDPRSAGQAVVFGAGQTEYEPLPAVVSGDGIVVTEWEPSAEDLAAMMCGARVKIEILTHGRPLQPLRVTVAG